MRQPILGCLRQQQDSSPVLSNELPLFELEETQNIRAKTLVDNVDILIIP